MGSNMAEAHPIAFRFVMQARERGATVIHVDPRFTRTSATRGRLRPDPRRHRHRLSRRRHPPPARARPLVPEYVVPYTNAPPSSRATSTRRARSRTASSPAGTREERLRFRQLAIPGRGGAVGLGRALPRHRGIVLGAQPPAARQAARGGPDARAPALRLPDPQAPLRALHARDGGAGDGLPEGPVPRHRRHPGPELGPRANRLDLLCRGLDPALGRRADDPRGEHPAAPAGQRRPARWRHPCPSRPRSIQGSTDIPTLYNMLPATCRCPAGPARTPSRATSEAGDRRLVAPLDKYIVSLLKAWYGEAPRPENDFGFGWLPRVSRRPLPLQGYWLRWRTARWRASSSWARTRRWAPNARLERKALAKLRWLVVRDLVETETATFWYDSPEVSAASWPRGDRHRGLPLPGRRPRREGRHLHQHPAHAAVAGEGGGAAGRRRSEPGSSTTSGLLKARASKGSRAATSPLRALVGLPDRGAARASRWWRRCCGDQRLADLDGGDGRGWSSRVGRGFTTTPGAELRRLDRLRLLDLLRRLRPGRREPGRRREPQRPLRPRLGLRLARRPAHPLQPRERRPRRHALERAQEAGLVGRGRRAKWTGHDVPDFTPQAARYRRRRRRRRRAPPPATRRSSCTTTGWGGCSCPSGLKDGPLPAHYEPLESPVGTRSTAARQPGRRALERPDNPYAAAGDPRFPARPHHLPADRAPHRRRHEPLPLAPGGAPAGAVLRDLAGARRSGGSRHGGWVSIVTPGARSRRARW
jgi:hypothetical protein